MIPDDVASLADRIGNDLVRLQRVRDRTIAHAKATDGIDPAVYACLYRLIHDGPMRSSATPSTQRRLMATIGEPSGFFPSA